MDCCSRCTLPEKYRDKIHECVCSPILLIGRVVVTVSCCHSGWSSVATVGNVGKCRQLLLRLLKDRSPAIHVTRLSEASALKPSTPTACCESEILDYSKMRVMSFSDTCSNALLVHSRGLGAGPIRHWCRGSPTQLSSSSSLAVRQPRKGLMVRE
jgi:hypothetical protein